MALAHPERRARHAAAALAVDMLVALVTAHAGKSFAFFVEDGGIELELLLGCACAAIVLAGAGRLSLDAASPPRARPGAASSATVGLRGNRLTFSPAIMRLACSTPTGHHRGCSTAAASGMCWSGSSRECARGQSRALVLRGEAGVGKTALLRHLSATANGCRIAWAAGVESEMELAFAGLHALCAPMLGRARAPAGSAARRAEHGVRPERRPAAGSLPRRVGGPEPAGRRRRGAAARVHRRRRAVARPGVRADARVRGAPAPGRARGTRLRGARVRRRRASARGVAGARDRGAARRRRPAPARRHDARVRSTSA